MKCHSMSEMCPSVKQEYPRISQVLASCFAFQGFQFRIQIRNEQFDLAVSVLL